MLLQEQKGGYQGGKSKTGCIPIVAVRDDPLPSRVPGHSLNILLALTKNADVLPWSQSAQ